MKTLHLMLLLAVYDAGDCIHAYPHSHGNADGDCHATSHRYALTHNHADRHRNAHTAPNTCAPADD